jgi:hemerythrin superfamily protein
MDDKINKKQCSECGEFKLRDCFYQNFSSKDGLHGQCKTCQNKRRYVRSKKNVEILRDKITMLKRNSPCKDCGKFYPPVCMDYDHKEGGKVNGRGSEVSNFAKQGRIQAALEEIEQCELVCSNCHRIRTATRRNWKHLL